MSCEIRYTPEMRNSANRRLYLLKHQQTHVSTFVCLYLLMYVHGLCAEPKTRCVLYVICMYVHVNSYTYTYIDTHICIHTDAYPPDPIT